MSTLPPPPHPPRESHRMAWVFSLAFAGLLLIAAVLYFGVWKSFPGTPARKQLPTAEESAYAAQIKFADVRVSRAENFLHQEVTTVSGVVVNAGSRTVSNLEITAEFAGEAQETVLRESVSVVNPRTPLAPGKSADFDIAVEHVPPSWNQQVPRLAITGLHFAPAN